MTDQVRAELADRLLDDAADYLDTLYERHSVGIFERGMDPQKLRACAAALRTPIQSEVREALIEAADNLYSAFTSRVRLFTRGQAEALSLYAKASNEYRAALSRTPPPSGSGTFLGYRNKDGHEMHCANAFCPYHSRCINGCICPEPRPPSGSGAGEKLKEGGHE